MCTRCQSSIYGIISNPIEDAFLVKDTYNAVEASEAYRDMVLSTLLSVITVCRYVMRNGIICQYMLSTFGNTVP
mgnify:CR=1 FL=1